MPRKRNGPPQENIDSILLALVRRDDIDALTLNHFFKRIQEEWLSGAREKILHLLNSRDLTTQNTAIHLLSELATEADLDEIEEFVADPAVNDMAKFQLAPLLQKLGSEMANEGMIEYLSDPVTAMQQMQLHILEGVEQSEMAVEAILNDVVSLPVEKRLDFVAWLGNSGDPRATSLLLPLLESETGKVAVAIIDALEQLGPAASSKTIPALDHLLASGTNRQLKQAARVTLGRLTMQRAPGAETATTPALPMYEARISSIDGTGSQMMMLAWQRPDGWLKIVNLFVQDRTGIKDCYGVDEMTMERWQQILSEMDEKAFGSFPMPGAYVHALITEARALSKRARHKLPIAFFVWRPLLSTTVTAEAQTAVATMLPSHPFDDEMRALALRGAELYGLREFTSWVYDPISTLEPYMSRFAVAAGLFPTPHTKGVRGRRKPKNTLKSEPLLNTVIDEALDEFIDTPWRLLYESRLRRQAQLLQLTEREQEARLAVAVASMLHPDSQVPPSEQPFLRTMMGISLEQGPGIMLAQMAEALGIVVEGFDTDPR